MCSQVSEARFSPKQIIKIVYEYLNGTWTCSLIQVTTILQQPTMVVPISLICVRMYTRNLGIYKYSYCPTKKSFWFCLSQTGKENWRKRIWSNYCLPIKTWLHWISWGAVHFGHEIFHFIEDLGDIVILNTITDLSFLPKCPYVRNLTIFCFYHTLIKLFSFIVFKSQSSFHPRITGYFL